MEPKSYRFDKYNNEKVKITGTFIYFPETCIIFNIEDEREFILEEDEDFLLALEENNIPNYKFEDTVYIFEECVLYGIVEKLQYSYILRLHNFAKK